MVDTSRFAVTNNPPSASFPRSAAPSTDLLPAAAASFTHKSAPLTNLQPAQEQPTARQPKSSWLMRAARVGAHLALLGSSIPAAFKGYQYVNNLHRSPANTFTSRPEIIADNNWICDPVLPHTINHSRISPSDVHFDNPVDEARYWQDHDCSAFPHDTDKPQILNNRDDLIDFLINHTQLSDKEKVSMSKAVEANIQREINVAIENEANKGYMRNYITYLTLMASTLYLLNGQSRDTKTIPSRYLEEGAKADYIEVCRPRRDPYNQMIRRMVFNYLRKNVLGNLASIEFSEASVKFLRERGVNPRLSGIPDGVTIKETPLPHGCYGEWVTPTKPHPKEKVILYFFGGAYIIGHPKSHRRITGNLAREANVPLLAVDYRKVPEHPYPAALDDGVNAYQYLLDQGYQPDNIVISGDSSGGHLALSVLQQLRTNNLPQPKSIALICPFADMTMSSNSIVKNASIDPVLPADRMTLIVDLFAGQHDRDLPTISPVYGSYEGAPDLFIVAGERDILCDDAIRLAHNAHKEHVNVHCQVWESMPHVFPMLDKFLPEARAAIKNIAGFIQEQLDIKELNVGQA